MDDYIYTIIDNFCHQSEYRIIKVYKKKPYVFFRWKSSERFKGLLNIEKKIAFCWNKDKVYISYRMWEKEDKNNRFGWFEFWNEIGNSHYLNKEKSLEGILRELILCQI